ncbi:MAG: YceI family protein [Actinomycetota bacterium]|nr:YceI family protein [Actinomycetota bacterium]
MPTRTDNKRHHLARWLPLIAVATLVALGAAVYVLFFTPDSVAELSLRTASTPINSDDLSGSWSPTSGSVAGYRVREKLAFLSAPSDAVGRTSDVSGTVKVSDDGSTIKALSGSRLQVNMRTLKSNQDRRDERIKTWGIETDTFPTASFQLTKDVHIPATIRDGKAVAVDAQGDLTLHGETRHVTMPLKIQMSGTTIQIVGSLKITMADYGIDVTAFGGFVSVQKTGTIELSVILSR